MAVKGLGKLQKQLAGIVPACASAAEMAMREAAEAARVAASALAPAKTGRLRASIRVEGAKDRASVLTDCPYASAVEFGRRGNPARPFMQMAAQTQRLAFSECACRRVGEALKGGKG